MSKFVIVSALLIPTFGFATERATERESKMLGELQRTLETETAATAASERAAIEAVILDQGSRRASVDHLPPEE